MPKIWIGDIQAPSQVSPDISFKISWYVWYVGSPFKKIKLISQIHWKGNIYRELHTVRPRFFFKRKVKTTVCISGIKKTTNFYISVGWRD